MLRVLFWFAALANFLALIWPTFIERSFLFWNIYDDIAYFYILTKKGSTDVCDMF